MSGADSFDVIVVGGGVIGLAIARALRKKRAGRVAIFERGQIGCEASWAAAGMLTPNAECTVPDDFHRFCSESAAMYPDFASELQAETGIDIQLDLTGTLCLAFTEADSREILERFECQKHAGIAVKHLSAADILEREQNLSPLVREGLYFPNDWQVENRKLVSALRRSCEIDQVAIYEDTKVDELFVVKGRVAGAVTSAGEFSAGHTVLSAGAWTKLISIGDRPAPIAVKPIRGQMISFEPDSKMMRHVIYSPRGYLVPRADGRILAGATVEDVGFNDDVTDKGSTELRNAAEEILPSFSSLKIAEQWAGLRPFVPPDGLPVLGPPGFPRGLTIATGHYRNGILLAPITAGIIASNIVDGVDSQYLRLFGPGRSSKTVGGVQT